MHNSEYRVVTPDGTDNEGMEAVDGVDRDKHKDKVNVVDNCNVGEEEENMVVSRIRENIKEKVREELKDELITYKAKTAELEKRYTDPQDDDGYDDKEDLDKLEPKLKKAILKMRHLDRILASKEIREKEVKRDRILLHRRICRELHTSKSNGRKETQDELTNMEKYLALEPPPTHNEGVVVEDSPCPPVTPLFDTQPNENCFTRNENLAKSAQPSSPQSATPQCGTSEHTSSNDNRAAGTRLSPIDSLHSDDCSELGNNSTTTKLGRTSGPSGGKDFIARNIQLAADADSAVAMTDDEKVRIKQLLSGIDEMPENDVSEDENPYQVCLANPGEGYKPEVVEKQNLERIESRLKELLPNEDYQALCVPSVDEDHIPPPLFSRSGVISCNSETLGEAMLQVIHDERSLNQRLKDIEHELDDFYTRTSTEFETPRLTEDRLSSLLDDCTRQQMLLQKMDEVDEADTADPDIANPDSLCDDYGASDTANLDDSSTPNDPYGSGRVQESRGSVLRRTPRLPDEVIAALLVEARLEMDRARHVMSDRSCHSDARLGSEALHGTSPLRHSRPLPYTIYSDVSHQPYDQSFDQSFSDDAHTPFLPEIPSHPSLVTHSNIQSYSSRNQVLLQSVQSEDFDGDI